MLQYPGIFSTWIPSPLLKVWTGFNPYIPCHPSVPGYLQYPDIFTPTKSMNWIQSLYSLSSFSTRISSIPRYLQSLYSLLCFPTRVASIPRYLHLYWVPGYLRVCWQYELNSVLISSISIRLQFSNIPGYLHLYWKYERNLIRDSRDELDSNLRP